MRKTILAIAGMLAFQLGAQNALNFDGTDDYVTSNFSGISGSSARTVEAWIRTTAIANPSSGGSQKVIMDWGTMATGTRFTFNVLWSNAIRLEVGGNGVSGTIPVNDGKWHHVACVWDPTATNKVKLYVDGVLDVQGTPTVTTNSISGNFVIGRRVDGVNYFDGDIDEVKVWNVARSLSDIVADTSAEYCGLPAGLVAYYRLNEGVASGNNAGINSTAEDVANATGTLNNFSLNGSSSNWVSGSNVAPGGANFVTVTASACNEYMGPGGMLYDSSGTYLDTLQNVYGCDSVIETSLTVQKLDVTVTVTSTDMTANKANATYRWLDCNNSYALVTGGTQRTFTPPNPSGSYAVQVQFGGCTDTSDCFTLVGVGLNENKKQSLRCFPNPSTGITLVDHSNIRVGTIAIYSVAGNKVMQYTDLSEGKTVMDLSSHPKGVYLIRLESKEATLVERLVLE